VNGTQQPAEKVRSPQVKKGTIVVMIIILGALASLAVFANIQRLRRGQIETIVVMPAGSTTPQPR